MYTKLTYHLGISNFFSLILFFQLDGYIARNVPGQSSKLGSFLDPLADKILVMTLYISLAVVNLIPLPLTAMIVSRDVLLVYAGLYIRYMSVDPPVSIYLNLDINLVNFSKKRYFFLVKISLIGIFL